MQQQVIDNFKKNGIKIKDSTTSLDLADKLGGTDVETLKKIVLEFYNGDTVPDVEGDDYVKTLAYSHALIDAFDFDYEVIEAADIEAAHQKAVDAIEAMTTPSNTETVSETEPEIVADTTPETPKPKKKNKKAIVSDLIDANPNATAPEIVDMATSLNPNSIEASTARMYFYNIRKERGLSPNGKRGRPSNDTKDKVQAIVSDNIDRPRDEVVEMIMNDLDLTKSTSEQYYSKAKAGVKKNA